VLSSGGVADDELVLIRHGLAALRIDALVDPNPAAAPTSGLTRSDVALVTVTAAANSAVYDLNTSVA
jgi:hypothetical protein